MPVRVEAAGAASLGDKAGFSERSGAARKGDAGLVCKRLGGTRSDEALVSNAPEAEGNVSGLPVEPAGALAAGLLGAAPPVSPDCTAESWAHTTAVEAISENRAKHRFNISGTGDGAS